MPLNANIFKILYTSKNDLYVSSFLWGYFEHGKISGEMVNFVEECGRINMNKKTVHTGKVRE